MIIKIGDKDYNLEFTYNSFKYMEDFNIDDLAKVEKHPFKIVTVSEQLLIGAIHSNRKVEISDEEIEGYLNQRIEEGTILELLESLMKLLEDSSFFKSLQKTTPKKKK